MYKFSDIRALQLEVSNYCNAACPQCPRNYFGGRTIPTLPLKTWTLVDFKKIFSNDLLQQLEQVYFCGTYGDPLTNPNIVNMCKFLKESNPNINIGIHTNGGVGKIDVFKQLAQYTDFIAFGIDGLDDTNHIYRRHVRWNKVIDNSQAFIKAGGHALWDYIVFKHNQHQVDNARLLSEQMGFKNFSVKYTSRFLNRKHEYHNSLPVYNNQGFIDYTLALPTDTKYINKNYEKLHLVQDADQSLSSYAKTTCISCNADRIKEVYIGADGFVFPCGWLHDRMYGPEVETHDDYVTIRNMMKNVGGLANTNIFHASLENIVNGPWFDAIADSWNGDDRLERCGVMCGDSVNLIQAQNTEIDYKE
jgi:MoaA/NifB/PqqE/SkfB family radical SAM enzyme